MTPTPPREPDARERLVKQMRHYLANLQSRTNTHPHSGPSPKDKTSGYSVAEVPDWQLMQWIELLASGVTIAPPLPPAGWRPIGEYDDKFGVVVLGLWVTVRAGGESVRQEWQRYLGYRAEDGSAREPEYDEDLPWEWDDFTHFLVTAEPPEQGVEESAFIREDVPPPAETEQGV